MRWRFSMPRNTPPPTGTACAAGAPPLPPPSSPPPPPPHMSPSSNVPPRPAATRMSRTAPGGGSFLSASVDTGVAPWRVEASDAAEVGACGGRPPATTGVGWATCTSMAHQRVAPWQLATRVHTGAAVGGLCTGAALPRCTGAAVGGLAQTHHLLPPPRGRPLTCCPTGPTTRPLLLRCGRWWRYRSVQSTACQWATNKRRGGGDLNAFWRDLRNCVLPRCIGAKSLFFLLSWRKDPPA